jgi:hypothetical protein
MVTNRFGRFSLVLAFVGWIPVAALADEVVHFTNGAEMTVKSHTVENGKAMVRLDLGGNSFISFPMSMVDKIVNAGKDVFLNPGFYPSNQAIASSAGRGVGDTTVRGIQGSAGLVPQPDGKGHAGVMLGEAADNVSGAGSMGALTNDTMANSRRRFNPAFQQPPGGSPQIIMPPSLAQPSHTPVSLTVVGAPRAAQQQIPATPPPPAPPQIPINNPTPDNPPAEDPAPEDPPNTP